MNRWQPADEVARWAAQLSEQLTQGAAKEARSEAAAAQYIRDVIGGVTGAEEQGEGLLDRTSITSLEGKNIRAVILGEDDHREPLGIHDDAARAGDTTIGPQIDTPALTDDDRSALQRYGGTSGGLNFAIRQNDMSRYQQLLRDDINSALSKLPDYNNKWVIRRVNLSPEALARYRDDPDLVEAAFTSASRTDKAAFGTDRMSGIPVEFQLLSKHGKDVSAYTGKPEEEEILFRSPTPFRTIETPYVDPQTGRTVIRRVEL